MSSEKAKVDVLFECFYMSLGVREGHPMLTFRWPLTPMPPPSIGQTYNGVTFNLASTNTILIRDEGKNIIIDPGIIQLGRYGCLPKRLAEFGLKPSDIDIVVNTHCPTATPGQTTCSGASRCSSTRGGLRRGAHWPVAKAMSSISTSKFTGRW
jgi:hypothetical protein